ncbi:hypothetical protein KNV00_gp072 [Streptomyces phage Bmoc]|uniref:Uncharacterized protein n=1 Tax=Streptomyces phage Bmoc TaxID=2725629 RepID=A0A6M3SYS1_9CAUD|nr:hypothetical protein KNV00_gp072 [Streptomyces phage Bmoc]QJD50947.1 hypothetical protein SEA_BMOC_239 [Streptomyces phage Bmoc]
MVTSIKLPYESLVQLFDLEGQPKSYKDRFVYHPAEFLEKV